MDMQQLTGAVMGLLALVVTAVIVRLIKRRTDRRRLERWQAAQPAASRQVRRAEHRKKTRG